MSILGRIGSHLGNRMRQLPGGNAISGALNKSPVLSRLPGARPSSPAQGLGPSPNVLQGMAGAGGGDIPPMRGPEEMGPMMPPEGPQNTGINGGMVPPPQMMQQGPPPPDQPMMQGPPQMMQQGPPQMKPSGGIGPDPAAMQQMMQKKQMMDQRNQMNRQQRGM